MIEAREKLETFLKSSRNLSNTDKLVSIGFLALIDYAEIVGIDLSSAGKVSNNRDSARNDDAQKKGCTFSRDNLLQGKPNNSGDNNSEYNDCHYQEAPSSPCRRSFLYLNFFVVILFPLSDDGRAEL